MFNSHLGEDYLEPTVSPVFEVEFGQYGVPTFTVILKSISQIPYGYCRSTLNSVLETTLQRRKKNDARNISSGSSIR